MIPAQGSLHLFLLRNDFSLYAATLTDIAKKELGDCRAEVSQLVKSGNKIGLNTDPCKTLLVMPSLVEHLSPTLAVNFLLTINIFSH